MSARTLFARAGKVTGLVVILALVSTTTVRAQTTLLNDSWTDGDRTNTNLPTDSPTWIGQPSGNGSISASPGSLDFVLGTSNQKAWEYFTSDQTAPDGNQPHNAVTHLSIGDTLTTTLTFTVTGGTSTSTSKNFRLGLFLDPTDARVQTNVNSDGGGGSAPWTDATGYALQFAINSAGGNSNSLLLEKRTTSNSSLLGDSGAYTAASSGGSAFAVLDNTAYSARLAFVVVSATQLDVTASVSQGTTVLSTVTRSDTGTAFGTTTIPSGLLPGSQGIYLDFDQFFFRNSSNAQMAGLHFTNLNIVKSGSALPITRGDFDFNNVVDSADLQEMLGALSDVNAYKTQHSITSDGQLLATADLNGDNVFDNADIQNMLHKLITGSFTAPIPAPVPEPAGIVSLGIGIILLRILGKFPKASKGSAVCARDL